MQSHIFADGQLEQTSDPKRMVAAHAAGHNIWIELGERTDEGERLLAETFGVHPLVVEDIFGERSVPKIDEFEDYLYVIVHGLRSVEDPAKVELGVLDIVIGRTFVLTQHREGRASELLRARLARSPRLLEQGPAWLAHAFIDAVVDRFLPFMDTMQARVDGIESRVVGHAGLADEKDLLPELFALKRAITSLCRIAEHQRDILQRLSRSDLWAIPAAARPYFRDVYDHWTRVAEQADSYKDTIVNATDAYLGVQSNRMNATMKRLTLMSTVMLPLNFIASFYGMNFKEMPELGWRWGYPYYVLLLMVAVAVAIWSFFKRRRWV